jgi:hypothetical protein
MKVVGCTVSSLQGKVNIFQFNINLFGTYSINYFNQQRDSSVTKGGMEAMRPRGNPSVVPRDAGCKPTEKRRYEPAIAVLKINRENSYRLIFPTKGDYGG